MGKTTTKLDLDKLDDLDYLGINLCVENNKPRYGCARDEMTAQ